MDSKSIGGNTVRVQVSPAALQKYGAQGEAGAAKSCLVRGESSSLSSGIAQSDMPERIVPAHNTRETRKDFLY